MSDEWQEEPDGFLEIREPAAGVEDTPVVPSSRSAEHSGRATSRRKQRFDTNAVHITGVIRRVWEERSDVLVRLVVPQVLVSHDPRMGAQEPVPFAISLRFPDGKPRSGDQVSLMDGLALDVRGTLAQSFHAQPLRSFLYNAHRINFYDDIPEQDAEEWEKLHFRRLGDELLVDEARIVPTLTARDRQPPQAEVSGVINDIVPPRGADSYGTRVRLAVYDTATKIIEPAHDGRFPRRRPHFVALLLPRGPFERVLEQLRPKDRVRASGELVERLYVETLRDALMDAHAIHLLEHLRDHDAPADIVVERTAYYVVPQALIRLNG